MSFQEKLTECPLIAILRGITPEEIIDVCDVLYEAGIRLLEVPFNSPRAAESIRRAAAHCRCRNTLMVGAGTVLTVEQVRETATAGGAFVISPNTDPAVIRATGAAGLISMPGFLTPTEAFTALQAGADCLKLFPAGAMGTGYIKDLKAVIKAPIYAVGGVGRENLADFLAVAAGAGIGSALYRPGKSLAELKEAAETFAAIARKSR